MNKRALANLAASHIQAAKDAKDVLSMDVPFFLRVLEAARETIKTDADLHIFVTSIIAKSKQTRVLTMQDYASIIGDKE